MSPRPHRGAAAGRGRRTGLPRSPEKAARAFPSPPEGSEGIPLLPFATESSGAALVEGTVTEASLPRDTCVL